MSRRSLMRNVSLLFNDMIQQLKTELEKIEYVCITADCWSIFHRSYMGFTIHWLNPITLERNSCALACRRMLGRHTYDNIAEIIEKVLTEFDIQSKTTLIVTDNAANFVKAFKVFGANNEIDNSGYNIEMCEIEIENDETLRTINITEILDGQTQNTQNTNDVLDIKLPKHQRCAAHTLNLIATVDILEAEKDGSYKVLSRRVFAKCQSVFNKQNQSTQCADKIKEILGRYLITPNATRWNSFYDAIKYIVDHIDKMDTIFSAFQLTPFSGQRESSFLIEYCKVMKPIATGLDVLQGEQHVCIGYLLPTITAINKALNEFNNLNFCRPLVHALKNGLTKRFKNYMQSKTLQVSSALVPKFKLIWANPEDRNIIKQHVIDRVQFHFDQNKNLSSLSSSNLETSSEEEDDFFSFSNDEISVINSDFQTLVTNYLSNTNIKVPLDLTLELKKAYIEFNTAIPSSAPVERLFSAGGQLFDKRRGSISDNNFEMSLLLKYNKYFK
ncbi:uncharacterized protein LOC112592896 [Melanaphis sacchari]|uniref:uncharacterized protein LOC112592896 n=1 Tax=Melanaphis sacchari TaxID=742174 RepID=UPI000DC13499|nr:uncharacterized protein LOC112592896 [Melanaphis sacchari]